MICDFTKFVAVPTIKITNGNIEHVFTPKLSKPDGVTIDYPLRSDDDLDDQDDGSILGNISRYTLGLLFGLKGKTITLTPDNNNILSNAVTESDYNNTYEVSGTPIDALSGLKLNQNIAAKKRKSSDLCKDLEEAKVRWCSWKEQTEKCLQKTKGTVRSNQSEVRLPQPTSLSQIYHIPHFWEHKDLPLINVCCNTSTETHAFLAPLQWLGDTIECNLTPYAISCLFEISSPALQHNNNLLEVSSTGSYVIPSLDGTFTATGVANTFSSDPQLASEKRGRLKAAKTRHLKTLSELRSAAITKYVTWEKTPEAVAQYEKGKSAELAKQESAKQKKAAKERSLIASMKEEDDARRLELQIREQKLADDKKVLRQQQQQHQTAKRQEKITAEAEAESLRQLRETENKKIIKERQLLLDEQKERQAREELKKQQQQREIQHQQRREAEADALRRQEVENKKLRQKQLLEEEERKQAQQVLLQQQADAHEKEQQQRRAAEEAEVRAKIASEEQKIANLKHSNEQLQQEVLKKQLLEQREANHKRDEIHSTISDERQKRNALLEATRRKEAAQREVEAEARKAGLKQQQEDRIADIRAKERKEMERIAAAKERVVAAKQNKKDDQNNQRKDRIRSQKISHGSSRGVIPKPALLKRPSASGPRPTVAPAPQYGRRAHATPAAVPQRTNVKHKSNSRIEKKAPAAREATSSSQLEHPPAVEPVQQSNINNRLDGVGGVSRPTALVSAPQQDNETDRLIAAACRERDLESQRATDAALARELGSHRGGGSRHAIQQRPGPPPPQSRNQTDEDADVARALAASLDSISYPPRRDPYSAGPSRSSNDEDEDLAKALQASQHVF